VALHACHTRKEGKIIHRDIKPGNIFLDNSTRVKLGDFGLSRILGKDSVYAYTHVGTPYYMSPEQLTDGKYTEKSDVWSTGCILYEMASLHPPFEAKN
jgi:NIMA (never in mitosis gene a)-related kinase